MPAPGPGRLTVVVNPVARGSHAAVEAIRTGVNQYPPGPGMPVLREAIAEHQRRFYGLDLDPDGSIGLTPTGLDGGEDHSLLATFPPAVAAAGLPAGFRAIGVVREPRADGHGLLVGGVPYARRSGWDPYLGWDGGVG